MCRRRRWIQHSVEVVVQVDVVVLLEHSHEPLSFPFSLLSFRPDSPRLSDFPKCSVEGLPPCFNGAPFFAAAAVAFSASSSLLPPTALRTLALRSPPTR